MNPLLAILAPQAPAPVQGGTAILPNGLNAVSSLPATVSGISGNAGVQVDSSSFLNILAAANSKASSAVAGNAVAEQAAIIDDPLARLASIIEQQKSLLTQQQRAVAGADSNAALGKDLNVDPKALTDLQTLPQGLEGKNGETARQILAKNLAGADVLNQQLNSSNTITGSAAYKNLLATQDNPQLTAAQLNSSRKLAANIVRPTGVSTLQTPENNNVFSNVVVNQAQLKTQKSFLSSSNLLNQLEGDLEPQLPTESEEVLNLKSTLNQATRAYLNIDGPENVNANNIKLLGGEEVKQFISSSNLANSNELSALLNSANQNTARTRAVASAYPQSANSAHQNYLLNPATQASIKIAKAITDGVRHINIELEPAKLGKMDVQMELSKEGHSRMVIYVEKHETLQLIQRDSSILERVLNDAGFKTDSTSLSFNLRDGGQHNNFAGHGANGNGGHGGNNNGAPGNDVNGELANNKNLLPALEYSMDLSNGVIDITV